MKRIWLALVCGCCLMLACVSFAAGSDWPEARGGAEGFASGQWPESRPVYQREALVEVLVDGAARDIYEARGKRYVEALQGEEYEVRVRNPYGVRVAVALAVDGLNTIDARRTSRWDSSKWLIEPYQTITIRGWQMSREQARRFYFTHERDSYGAKLGRTSDLGLISAVFFRERQSGGYVTPRPMPREPRTQVQKDSDANTDERSRSSSHGAGQTSNSPAQRGEIAPAPDDEYAATGIGRSVRHDVRWVNLDLDPRPAAEVTIRYEFRDALVRLGVLPRNYREPDPLRRRERARGFEDQRFCPEP
ncbi:MAG TPA: hypothetical protein VNA19_17650 [Pyrinomonadaceae bacterium]|nr:hypothetical protein [Pyrinomonadaceae bacterium]